MEIWINFAEKVIGYIVWPLCVLLIAFILRKEISVIFSNLKVIKGAGFELQFSNTLNVIEKEISDDLSGIKNKDFISEISDEITSVAEKSPAAAIPHAWSKIEQAIREKIHQVDPKTKHFYVSNIVKKFQDMNCINEKTAEALDRMRKLRNDICYGDGKATYSLAVDYGKKTELLINIINNITDNPA
jgi:hypothetical protein